MTTLHLRKSIGRSPLRLALLLIPLALAWSALSPTAQAQLPPPAPDGGYPNGNTAEGTNALKSLKDGIDNTALGFDALFSNTHGNYNTATGFQALFFNTTGFDNTATGWQALFGNQTGFSNTATGNQALGLNKTGSGNTAAGFQALFNNNSGGSNTANGLDALFHNTRGNLNTAIGEGALFFNTTGSQNIALGLGAGENLTTGSNNIDIGNFNGNSTDVAGESNTIRIGAPGLQTATFIAGIHGATVASGVTVIVDANGHLGTATSSERFKEEIEPMDKASEAILALKPVTFRYKKELDPDGIPQFGLIAEQVEKVSPELVARDADGKVYTVRYEAVNAMLLNEFLKEHRKVEDQDRKVHEQEATIDQVKSTVAKQETIIAEQQAAIKVLTASLKEQASQIQKVSAQVELNKPASQVVVNNQ